MAQELQLRITSRPSEKLNLGNAIPVPAHDYNELDNKPSINERTLVGNKTVAWLLQDGLILDGGNAEVV